MFLPLLALFLLPLCLAATPQATQQKLSQLAIAGNGVIQLDEALYNELTASKRNWSASVLFTAMDPKRRCTPCKEFDPSFRAVAKSWLTVPAATRDTHFFAIADFDSTMPVFSKLGIQSAPVVHMLPATEGPRKPASGRTTPAVYDFSNGFDAAPLAEQLSAFTPVPIPYKAPIDWARWASVTGIAMVSVSVLRFILPILRSRWVWAAGTIVTSLVMTSGFMFVRIRGMPQTDHTGAWIAQGYQSQYGQETNVVAFIYGMLSLSFLMLTLITPYQASPTRQRMQVYLWSGVILILFSVLISFFHIKHRGYPFRLLL